MQHFQHSLNIGESYPRKDKLESGFKSSFDQTQTKSFYPKPFAMSSSGKNQTRGNSLKPRNRYFPPNLDYLNHKFDTSIGGSKVENFPVRVEDLRDSVFFNRKTHNRIKSSNLNGYQKCKELVEGFKKNELKNELIIINKEHSRLKGILERR